MSQTNNVIDFDQRPNAEVIEISLLQAIRKAMIEGELQNCKTKEEERETVLAYLLHCEMENQIRFERTRKDF